MGTTEKERRGFSELLARQSQLQPQEMLLPVAEGKRKPIALGIPKELAKLEKRVAMRPEAVAILANSGFHVKVESGAGNPAKHSDREYSDAGAEIVYSSEDAFQSDIVLKIAPPTMEEIEYMKAGQALISTVQLGAMKEEYLHALNKKRLTSMAFELLQDRVGGLPMVRAMSEIAGSTVMLIAAEYLSSINDGKGLILGGITGVPPTKVVILGAGTVAEYATRTALGLGAEVKVFDNHIYRLRRLKELLGQHHLYTSAIDSVMLRDAITRADVVIGALRADDGGRTPCVVTEEMVAHMKPNSVIIDVSIDHGGCFETSEPTNHLSPTFRKYDVIHYCVPNIASRVARTATTAISNIISPLLVQVANLGGIDKMIFEHPWFAKGVYTYRGGITSRTIAHKFNLKHKNLNLIIAAHL
jgi:alanine dehydrogenase